MGYVKTIIALFVAIFIVGIFYYLSLNGDQGFSHFLPGSTESPSQSLPLGRVLLSVLAMVIGMLFGALYEQIGSQKDSISFRNEILTVLKSSRLFRSLLAAPILFVGVYTAAQSQPDLVVSLIFAFQNGFFCDAIMKKKEASPV